MMNKTLIFMVAVSGLIGQQLYAQQETLPPLKDGKAPQTFEELWARYDPRVEPLEIETLKEWEEDGVVLRVVRYRIGIFKGQKAMMAAVYGYPKLATKLPGLVQIHGGGQYADYRAVLTNAQRGYATISISWAGRINAPGYKVDPKVVKLFFDAATNDPDYKLTTDWGALDGYHAPHRNRGNSSFNMAPASWTLDAVESPRNSPYFLWTVGARRALTFLEQQPQVDPAKLGVYGHSMGAKITVLTAASDSRVKVAAPSSGGISYRKEGPLYQATLADNVSLRHLTCPIIFLSPANDFHGKIDALQWAIGELKSKQWRVTCSAHHNHQDTAPYEVATQLWFDQYLKGTFQWPQTPDGKLELKTSDGVLSFVVTPDASRPFLSVDVYYTQQGDGRDARSRFWRHAVAVKTGDTWTAKLPILSTDEPLWVYANITYPLDKPVSGAGYYYASYTADQFNLSSLMPMAMPEQLKAAGFQATLKPSLMIETFEEDWRKEWFSYKPQEWARSTYKISDDQYVAPSGAKLALEVRSSLAHKVVVEIDKNTADIQLVGDGQWQQVILSPADFQNRGRALADWRGIKQLRLGPKDKSDPEPEFRNLRWVVENIE